MASEDNKIGLIPATLMVAGNMMGSGYLCFRQTWRPLAVLPFSAG